MFPGYGKLTIDIHVRIQYSADKNICIKKMDSLKALV